MRKIILIILIPITLLLLFTLSIAFSKNYYMLEFQRIKPEATLNIDPKYIRYAAQVIPEYLMGKRNNLDIPGFKNFFNEKELLHMEDVKNIFKYTIISSIVFSFLIILLIKKEDLPYIFIYSLIPIIIFILIVFIFSFDQSFTIFHKIFFKNDLWLLDPEKDRLIVLLPIEFFIRSFTRIIYLTIITLLTLFFFFYFLEVNFERKNI
ncbi:MAG: TIGR01906 family membrane protein [Caldisericia bacterium]|nr:TIGR01906 family membrane protein [Caldisericia bacterium]